MAKFVSLDNLKTFLAELRKIFVVQESGKVLTTNDYTTTEKEKLATIEASAQENKIESIFSVALSKEHINSLKDAINKFENS